MVRKRCMCLHPYSREILVSKYNNCDEWSKTSLEVISNFYIQTKFVFVDKNMRGSAAPFAMQTGIL